jgi:hypothetical protein
MPIARKRSEEDEEMAADERAVAFVLLNELDSSEGIAGVPPSQTMLASPATMPGAMKPSVYQGYPVRGCLDMVGRRIAEFNHVWPMGHFQIGRAGHSQVASEPFADLYSTSVNFPGVDAWVAHVQRVGRYVVEGVGRGRTRGFLDRLSEIASLERNWDSYGSEPPTPQSISAARDLIERVVAVAAEAGSPFSIAPLSGGGVQIEWRRGVDVIEVEIDGDRGRSGLIIQGEGQRRAAQEFDDVSDEELLALISSVVAGC